MINRSHRYEVGQKLLCFEPDSSKAKLIYFAKILKYVYYAESDVPYYGVHFHGWKCKWDRQVSEDLLLENNEFNRMLKRKIDEVAHHVRGRHQREQRIDMILEKAALCSDDVNWDEIPGVWKGKKSFKNRKKQSKPVYNLVSSPRLNIYQSNAEVFSDCDDSSLFLNEEEVAQLQFEQLELHELFAIPLVLLKRVENMLKVHSLGSDPMSSNVLPRQKFFYWCSVLQLFQTYVDGFPYNGLTVSSGFYGSGCGISSDRVSRIMNPLYVQSDKSRVICADVMSSIRILFDSIFHDYLLLNNEKAYSFERLVGQLYMDGKPFAHLNALEGPSNIESMHGVLPTRYNLLPDCEIVKSPQLPCLNSPPHFLLRLFGMLPNLLKDMELTACRRSIIHRHVYLFFAYLDRTWDYWFGPMPPPNTIGACSTNTTSKVVYSDTSSNDTVPLTTEDVDNRPNRKLSVFKAVSPSERSSKSHSVHSNVPFSNADSHLSFTQKSPHLSTMAKHDTPSRQLRSHHSQSTIHLSKKSSKPVEQVKNVDKYSPKSRKPIRSNTRQLRKRSTEINKPINLRLRSSIDK